MSTLADATVAIVTRNRCSQLRKALQSAAAQEGSLEVVVVDDGSTDGTSAMVRAEFPQARLERFETSAGLVARRNQAARLARAPVIVSIDDDALLSSPCAVRQTLNDFDHPRVGAVAIPYVDVNGGASEEQRAPEPSRCWVAATFRGTAYAVRRDLFLALGGFRETILHQGEEPDFSLRMLAAGYVVRLGRSDQIQHFESPHRDLERMDVYGRRNELLWAFTYFPFPWNLALMLGYTAKGLVFGLRTRRPRSMLRGLAFGVRSCWQLRHERRPLPQNTIRLDRRLRRDGPVPIEDLESELPAVSFAARPA